MAHNHLHVVREFELREVLRLFPQAESGASCPRILEIGAGTGYQAAVLRDLGYRVSAVELASSAYAASRVFDVIDYDGIRLPFDDASFDVVFSSNVLEHVLEIDGMLAEIARVMGPGAIALHVLPTPAWRVWTTLAHAPWVLSRLFVRLARSKAGAGAAGGAGSSRSRMLRELFPSRHGERGNFLTEALYFSPSWWRRKFRAAGFVLDEERPVGLFYTGCMLLRDAWSVRSRRRWSRVLGSSCRIYRMSLLERNLGSDG